ncbi:MAG: hypothetical protein PHR53_08385, partial [Bacteroidales bacterium]|nr:hypothetical protein [Bacteroidales bacterium]
HFININAQSSYIKKFTPDAAIFIQEVDALVSPVTLQNISFDGVIFMEQFKKDWTNGVYTPQEQEKMFEIVNKMVDKRFQVRTYIAYFISSQRLKQRTQDRQGWEAWHQGLNYIADHERHEILSNYLLATETLLLRNAFSSFRKVDWLTTDTNYQFRFDSIPYIEFPTTDIFICFNQDTIRLHQTSGRFYPLQFILKGNGGTFYWDRQKISHEKIWAELSSYSLETLIQEVRFENVRFYHKDYFSNYITGTIEDKAYDRRADFPYPKFVSDKVDLEIRQLYQNFDYQGGFRMSGANIFGYGTLEQLANLYVSVNQVNNISMKSLEFAFSPNHITSDKVSFNIRCDKDSLYHPEMVMAYNNISKEITLMKGKGTMGAMSVIDSYHKVDISCEALSWKLESGEIDFTADIGIKKTAKASFVSHNYFRARNYRKLQGLDVENPLNIIVPLSERLNSDFISFDDIAQEMKTTLNQAKLLMAEIAQKDFIFFDYAHDGIILRDKAKIYPLAYQRKIDYDNLIFNSNESKTNAKLILDSKDMFIFNIDRIWLSDSQAVGIMTYVNDIVLQKNRDFSFLGFVGAGSFDFFTDSLVYSYFSYQDFSITLPLISSLEFWVDDSTQTGADGNYLQIPVTSFIEQISGKLYIDEPNNKSGIKHYDKYSYFEAGITDRSAIYYNLAYAPEKYPKDRFRFKVFPFIINDLQKTNIETMKIPGMLESSNIIPDLETVATLRPDYSLGFNMLTPEDGFSMYQGKGRFKGTIDLSNHGFFADGALNYLSSTSISDEKDIWDEHSFVFFPDSSLAKIETFDIQEVKTGVEFPIVHGDTIDQRWYPYQQLMVNQNIGAPFSVFKEKLQFSGAFHLSPMGLKGLGKINLTQMSIVSSNDFLFKSTSFSSPNADVSILSRDLRKPVFNAYHYAFTMDMEKRSGEFVQHDDSSYVDFPENYFMATGFNFLLNMDSMTFNLYTPKEPNPYSPLKNMNFLDLIDLYDNHQIHGPLITSTNIHHNGLCFNSYKAQLSVLPDQHILHFSEIPLIKIADSYIIPKDGQFEVADHPDTIYLPQSELMLKKDSIHHYIYDADIKVLGQDEYLSQKATYDYISLNDTIPIHLNNIYIDKNTKTSEAKGFIDDSINFQPSPYFNYYGDVKLNCESPFLQFFGYLNINEDDCDTLSAPWIAIDTIIDPKHPVIPIPKKTFNDENKVTFNGLAHGFNGHYFRFYNSLFRPIKNVRNDDTIFSIHGLMVYDELYHEYRIGEAPVLENPTEPYNLLRYNPTTCMTIGNGIINLHPHFAQDNINLKTYGSYFYNHNSDSLYFDLTTELYLPFNKKLMEKIVNLLVNSSLPSGESLHKPFMNKYFNYCIGKERREELSNNYLNSKYVLPKEFSNTFVFSNIPFRWKQSEYSYYYSGEVELTLAHQKIINKKIPISIIYQKHLTGNNDKLQIYFETDDDHQFFLLFNDRGKSFIWSSNIEIQTLISDKDDDKDKTKKINLEWIDEKAVQQFFEKIRTFE